MITELKIVFLKHLDLSENDICKIISLKIQHWDYSEDSHKEWLSKNLNGEDYHLWIEDKNGIIIAYLNIVHINIYLGAKEEYFLGIGNVCVDLEAKGNGLGILLMSISNYYIRNLGSTAILLCKNTLMSFYKKTGWKEFQGIVTLAGKDYNGCLMSTVSLNSDGLEINKNF